MNNDRLESEYSLGWKLFFYFDAVLLLCIAAIPLFLDNQDSQDSLIVGVLITLFLILSAIDLFITVPRFSTVINTDGVTQHGYYFVNFIRLLFIGKKFPDSLDDIKEVSIPFDEIEKLKVRRGMVSLESKHKEINIGNTCTNFQQMIDQLASNISEMDNIKFKGSSKYIEKYFGISPETT